jgi:hypothetical protein
MASETTIKSIIVLPYSMYSCKYIINDGQEHATTYDKINVLLSEKVPLLIYQISEALSKRNPFFIDVVNMKFSVLSFDEANSIEALRKKIINYTSIKDSGIVSTVQEKYSAIVDKIMKKLYIMEEGKNVPENTQKT